MIFLIIRILFSNDNVTIFLLLHMTNIIMMYDV